MGHSMNTIFLVVQLEAVISAINATIGETPSLMCEMNGFLRPDADLLWRRGEQVITNEGRFSITYTEGIPGRGQNGGDGATHSRLSSLTISEVEFMDEGAYTCFIQGTEEVATVQLRVSEQQQDTTTPPTGMHCIVIE